MLKRLKHNSLKTSLITLKKVVKGWTTQLRDVKLCLSSMTKTLEEVAATTLVVSVVASVVATVVEEVAEATVAEVEVLLSVDVVAVAEEVVTEVLHETKMLQSLLATLLTVMENNR